MGDVCQCLPLLLRNPAEISAGHGGFHQILNGREFAIKVQEGLTSFHTEGIDQGWRIAWCVGVPVVAGGDWAATCEVGIGAIPTIGHAPLFMHKMAGAAIDRLTGEWPREGSVKSFWDINDGVTRLESGIDIPIRMAEEELSEAGFQK
jgi:hypothetical protein